MISPVLTYYQRGCSFNDSPLPHEVFYGPVKLQPMLFQDDAIKLSTSRNGAQNGNLKVESIMKSKLLEIHPDKSCYLVVADKTNQEMIKKEIDEHPFAYDMV